MFRGCRYDKNLYQIIEYFKRQKGVYNPCTSSGELLELVTPKVFEVLNRLEKIDPINFDSSLNGTDCCRLPFLVECLKLEIPIKTSKLIATKLDKGSSYEFTSEEAVEVVLTILPNLSEKQAMAYLETICDIIVNYTSRKLTIYGGSWDCLYLFLRGVQ